VRPIICATTAVEATFTSTTWSRPTLLKLFSSAITPWISCALIIAVSTSRTVSGARPAATLLREIQSAVARMPPRLSDGWPHSAASHGVVEIEPADHAADVEGSHHGIELELRARHLRAVGNHRAGDDGAEKLRACRERKGLETAAQRVHEAIARGLVRVLAGDLVFLDVIDDVDQDLVRIGPHVADMG
jgi:hypothetical protein